MKHIIILGDGMADHRIERLGGKTLLQYAETPYMDMLAREGRTGRLITIPDNFHPGSEVANTAILGYNLDKVYEGRGPLEAASIGYEMQKEDLALRCNIITLCNGKIVNHHGGHLKTEEGGMLTDYLDRHLGNEKIRFIKGTQYRHLLIVKGGSKHIECAPPHDHPEEQWKGLLVRPERGWENRHEEGRMSAAETAELLNGLILKSQELLPQHPFNIGRKTAGKVMANSIWPWGGGYRPQMETIADKYAQVKTGSVISATGLADTNYEGKAEAAVEALKSDDFVFLHIEASDEAGHDGDLELKLQTIRNLDSRIVGPIYNKVKEWHEPVCIALLPDHPTPVEIRTHVKEPVPFAIWHPHIEPDSVCAFDEESCGKGSYGMLYMEQFMDEFMKY